ncbi:MAG: hypothetical protein HOV83_31610 [Catenulispora sp.]|nr:hypothetical protein [Catenulispora sp.]
MLRFAGVEVHRGAAPPLPSGSPSALPGTAVVGLDEARRSARFPIGVPEPLGPPDRVEVADRDASGAPRVVTLVYRNGSVRLDEFDGHLSPGFAKTEAGAAAEWLSLGNGSWYALWFPAPHPLVYIDRAGVERTETARLSGPCLVWEHQGVTYRLEGIGTSAEATAVALAVGGP